MQTMTKDITGGTLTIRLYFLDISKRLKQCQNYLNCHYLIAFEAKQNNYHFHMLKFSESRIDLP